MSEKKNNKREYRIPKFDLYDPDGDSFFPDVSFDATDNEYYFDGNSMKTDEISLIDDEYRR